MVILCIIRIFDMVLTPMVMQQLYTQPKHLYTIKYK